MGRQEIKASLPESSHPLFLNHLHGMSLDGEVPFHFQWGFLLHNFVMPLRERDGNGRKKGKKGKRREREKQKEAQRG